MYPCLTTLIDGSCGSSSTALLRRAKVLVFAAMIDGGLQEACAADVEGEIEHGQDRLGLRRTQNNPAKYMLTSDAMKEYGKEIPQNRGERPDPSKGTFLRTAYLNNKVRESRRKLTTCVAHYENRDTDTGEQEAELKEAEYQYNRWLAEEKSNKSLFQRRKDYVMPWFKECEGFTSWESRLLVLCMWAWDRMPHPETLANRANAGEGRRPAM